jgi:hypothetical protein
MKLISMPRILAAMWMSVLIIPSYAQEQSIQHQGYIIWEDIVFPSRVGPYEKMVREQMALYEQAGFPYRIDIYHTTTYHYYWVFEIDSYADIDTLHQEFNRIYREMPDQLEAINEGYAGTHESTRSWTCYADRSLSFKPRGLHQPDSERPYLHMGFCYPEKGHMQQARDVMRGYAELATQQQAELGWDTFIGDMGVEAPMLFWVSFTKDASEFFRLNAADFDRMGDQADVLWNTLQGVMRKYEEKTGWFRKDLSYDPS